MNKSHILIGILGTVLFTSSAIGATTIVNSFEPTLSPDGIWYESDVRTGGAAAIVDLTGTSGNLESNQPLPVGAAKITTDFTNAAKAEVAVNNNFGTVQSILGTWKVSYYYYKASNAGQNLTAAPSIKLTFFNPLCLASSDCYGTLVYEPSWNGLNAPSSSNPPLDTWKQEGADTYEGYFWWTGGFGQPNGAGGTVKTFANWYAAFDTDFPGATLVSVSVGVGSYNQGQIGYFDNVAISGTNADATYDFEPAPQFETVGECVSTLIAESCSTLKGRDRANCNHEQQMICFDLFGVK